MTAEQQAPRTEAYALRKALLEIAEGTEPDRIGKYEYLRDWIHKTATRAIEQEAARPLPEPQPQKCEWCGAPLVNEDGVWIDRTYNSGEFCPEGEDVGPTGTSPHEPVGVLPDRPEPSLNVGERLELDEHGLPTSEERRRAAYTIALLPAELRLRFIREVGQQMGYQVSRLCQPPDPATARCDRIVNNGMGEPTECGRTLPCEYHDSAACGEWFGGQYAHDYCRRANGHSGKHSSVTVPATAHEVTSE